MMLHMAMSKTLCKPTTLVDPEYDDSVQRELQYCNDPRDDDPYNHVSYEAVEEKNVEAARTAKRMKASNEGITLFEDALREETRTKLVNATVEFNDKGKLQKAKVIRIDDEWTCTCRLLNDLDMYSDPEVTKQLSNIEAYAAVVETSGSNFKINSSLIEPRVWEDPSVNLTDDQRKTAQILLKNSQADANHILNTLVATGYNPPFGNTVQALHKYLEEKGGAKDDWIAVPFQIVEGYDVTIYHLRNEELELVRAMIGDPKVKAHFKIDAYHKFTENGERFLDGEVMSARFATETQGRLREGYKHFIFSAAWDSSNVTDHLDVFPMYLVCHNYDLSIKFKFNNIILVALIPILQRNHSYFPPGEETQYHEWRLIQEVQRLVLKVRD